MHDLPYEGVRVLELGSRVAAGACGRLLADLGAEVYVAEPRQARGRHPGKWADRAVATAGKQSLLFDPAEAGDVELLVRLLAAIDVVLLSTDADLGWLTSDLLAAVQACPIVCDITAFGANGPLHGQYADELELQALTGVLDTTGPAGGQAVPIGVPVLEMSGAMYAASAIAAALHVLRRDGVGQSVEIALFDVGVNSLTTFMPAHYAGTEPRRLGNGHGMAVPWNAYPTADGWLLICSTNDAQWRRLAGLIDPALNEDSRYETLKSRLEYRAEIDALVSAWTRGLSLADAVARLGAQGVPCGSIVPVAALDQEPNLMLRGLVAQAADPVEGQTVRVPNALFQLGDGRPAAVIIPPPDNGRAAAQAIGRAMNERQAPKRPPDAAPRPPFEGLRVVEIGQLTTAPLAARHLASFGADVIKVEPGEGESARAWAPLRGGVSHFFVASNGEKRSLALDLRNPADAQRLAKLLADADVLVENMKPGALARMGFPAQRLHQLNPRLVYCAISGFGVHSVYEGRPAVDTVIQAMSGMMDATRTGGMPLKTGISSADIAGGVTGLLAIMAALARRERTGTGCVIDISMQDVGAWMTQTLWRHPPAGDACPANTLAVAQVCDHPQTRARELIVTRKDAAGRSWEVFSSPMRLSATPASVGTLLGDPARAEISWRPMKPGGHGAA